MIRSCVAMLAVGFVAVWPSDAVAQDLGRIEVLGIEGRTADARDSLLGWWDVEWAGASRADREHALWLRGLLTLDPAEASTSYRRIVTEYPGGVYTGRALHRLGSLAAAVGDTVAAGQWFTMLARDFSGSPLGERADAWLAGDRSALVGAASAPVRPDPPAVPVPGPDIVDTGPDLPPAAEVSPVDDEPAPTMPWTVQLGAFSSGATAREIAGEARAAGFEIRVVLVEGSDLWRVRSGRFVDADAARPLLERMRSAGLVAAIVPGADQEVSGG